MRRPLLVRKTAQNHTHPFFLLVILSAFFLFLVILHCSNFIKAPENAVGGGKDKVPPDSNQNQDLPPTQLPMPQSVIQPPQQPADHFSHQPSAFGQPNPSRPTIARPPQPSTMDALRAAYVDLPRPPPNAARPNPLRPVPMTVQYVQQAQPVQNLAFAQPTVPGRHQIQYIQPPSQAGPSGTPIAIFPSAQQPIHPLRPPPPVGTLRVPIFSFPSVQANLQQLQPYQIEHIQRYAPPPHVWHLLQPGPKTTSAPSQSPTTHDVKSPPLPLMPAAGTSEYSAVEGLLQFQHSSAVHGSQYHESLPQFDDEADSESPNEHIIEDIPLTASRGRGRGRGRKRPGRQKGFGLKKADEEVANAGELRFAVDQVLGNMYPKPGENLSAFTIRVLKEVRVYLAEAKLMFYQNLSARVWFQEQVAMVYNFYKGNIGGSSGAGSSSQNDE